MRIVLILPFLLMLFGCTNLSSNKTETKVNVICEWGTQKFDLCQFNTHEDMIEGLIATMTLDEKIGQMTQSVWHNSVSP